MDAAALAPTAAASPAAPPARAGRVQGEGSGGDFAAAMDRANGVEVARGQRAAAAVPEPATAIPADLPDVGTSLAVVPATDATSVAPESDGDMVAAVAAAMAPVEPPSPIGEFAISGVDLAQAAAPLSPLVSVAAADAPAAAPAPAAEVSSTPIGIAAGMAAPAAVPAAVPAASPAPAPVVPVPTTQRTDPRALPIAAATAADASTESRPPALPEATAPAATVRAPAAEGPGPAAPSPPGFAGQLQGADPATPPSVEPIAAARPGLAAIPEGVPAPAVSVSVSVSVSASPSPSSSARAGDAAAPAPESSASVPEPAPPEHAPPATAPTAPTANAAPVVADPPPVPAPPRPRAESPVRQIAPIAIAVALTPGRAPRLLVTLEPEALGRVEIQVERGAEGEATAVRVIAERPETLALLQRDARELTRALDQAGLAAEGRALSFSLAGDERGGGERPRHGGSGGTGRPIPIAPPPATIAAALGLLDIAV